MKPPRTSVRGVAMSDFHSANEEFNRKFSDVLETDAEKKRFYLRIPERPSQTQKVLPRTMMELPSQIVKTNKIAKEACLTGTDCLYDKPYIQDNLVPWNSNNIKNVGSISLTDVETKDLENKIGEYKAIHLDESLRVKMSYTVKKWKRFPKEINHPFRDAIVSYMKYELKKIFPNRDTDLSGIPFLIAETINVVRDSYKLLECKVYITDKSKFMSRRLRVQFLVDSKRIIQINELELDRSNSGENIDKFQSLPSNKEYIETRNTLYLQGPFKTNDYITKISTQDHEVYQKGIRDHKVQEISEPEFKCFGSMNVDAKSKFDCINAMGVWDSPVRNSTECPYFMGNLNYPNSFGGKRGYSCQVPMGAELVGYKHTSADPKQQPLCYNCQSDLIGDGTLGRCCDKQTDSQLYPELQSPDYAYTSDQAVRKQYSELFAYRNLSLD